MRNIRAALILIITLVLTACGTISSDEVATGNLRTKIVTVTTLDSSDNPVTDLYVSFHRNLNPVNLSPGDTVTAVMDGHQKALTVADSRIDLLDGTSYQATFGGATDITITLHRADGNHTARIMPHADTIYGLLIPDPAPNDRWDVHDNQPFVITWSDAGGEGSDDVTVGMRLDSCASGDEDFVALINGLYQYTIPLAEAKYGDRTITLVPGSVTGGVDDTCEGFLLLSRIPENTDVQVHYGSKDSSSRAIFTDEIPINFFRTEP